jgi:hypothetical protein
LGKRSCMLVIVMVAAGSATNKYPDDVVFGSSNRPAVQKHYSSIF